MRRSSSFSERAPRARVFRLLAAMVLVVHGTSHAAVLSPTKEGFETCSPVTTVRAVELKERATSRELYYMRVRPGGNSTDERMLRSLQMQGAIFAFSIALGAPAISNQADVIFTGTVYKRRPSLVQRALGGARDELFYVVEIHGERALLSVSAFYEPPVIVCEKALGKRDHGKREQTGSGLAFLRR